LNVTVKSHLIESRTEQCRLNGDAQCTTASCVLLMSRKTVWHGRWRSTEAPPQSHNINRRPVRIIIIRPLPTGFKWITPIYTRMLCYTKCQK